MKEVIFTHQSPKGKKIHNFETKELVLGSLAKFSDKFYKFGKELIEEQIDWMPKLNKRSGAFALPYRPRLNHI